MFKKNIIWIAIAIFSLLLVSVFCYSLINPKEPSAFSATKQKDNITTIPTNEGRNSSESPDPAQSVTSNDFSLQENKLTLIESYDSADSAIEKADLIEVAASRGYLFAKDWRIELDSFCQPEDLIIDNYKRELEWVFAKKQKFCNGYTPSVHISQMEVSELLDYYSDRHADYYFDSIIEDYSNNKLNHPEDFRVLVQSVETPIELGAISRAIVDLYANENAELWPVLDAIDIPPSANPLEIQNAALKLIECRRFGCSSNRLETVNHCIILEICHPGWSYNDIILNIMSPSDYQVALELANFLQQ